MGHIVYGFMFHIKFPWTHNASKSEELFLTTHSRQRYLCEPEVLGEKLSEFPCKSRVRGLNVQRVFAYFFSAAGDCDSAFHGALETFNLRHFQSTGFAWW